MPQENRCTLPFHVPFLFATQELVHWPMSVDCTLLYANIYSKRFAIVHAHYNTHKIEQIWLRLWLVLISSSEYGRINSTELVPFHSLITRGSIMKTPTIQHPSDKWRALKPKLIWVKCETFAHFQDERRETNNERMNQRSEEVAWLFFCCYFLA